ncbi:hypothetical protein BASA60_000941 [Batrachochytrium salamandrivorans]|nr:hypothetical protein BASA60_000941 [Batrachochytrium salamandrivorans]KAH9274150.1 hypothetical protein BASA83_003454 [Batrachochytrium salamandrivorans]
MSGVRQRKDLAGKGTAVLKDLTQASASISNDPVNPTTTHFEFMGPHGTLLAVLGLPLTTVALFLVCSQEGCPPSWLMNVLSLPSTSVLATTFTTLSSLVANIEWLNLDAFNSMLCWTLLHGLLGLVLPGRSVQGTHLRTGDRLNYTINGFNALVFCAIVTVTVTAAKGLDTLIWIADHSLQLAVASILISTTMAALLYAASFRSSGGSPSATTTNAYSGVLLAKGGNSGYPIYDFWMGRELNPRMFWGRLDLKYLCELRPGLIGWTLLNIAFCAKQFSLLGYVTTSMLAVVSFQAYYVIDALWNEEAILTTMDITTDGFGFMLVFGDLTWVPFVYTLQSRYLSMFPQDLSLLYLCGVVALNMLGLWVFRGSNGQKNAFRSNPNGDSVKHLEYMTTKSGSKLLVTGWWGCARKINYTGDWLMALAWCLPCGFDTPIPYFYVIYFAVLLIHRAHRDEIKCRSKYGSDWDIYRKKVPYLFLPYVW